MHGSKLQSFRRWHRVVWYISTTKVPVFQRNLLPSFYTCRMEAIYWWVSTYLCRVMSHKTISSLIAYGNNSTLWRITRKKQLIEWSVTMYSINALLSLDCIMNPIFICCYCCFQAPDSFWNGFIVLMLTMLGILVTSHYLTLQFIYPGSFSVSLWINYLLTFIFLLQWHQPPIHDPDCAIQTEPP